MSGLPNVVFLDRSTISPQTILPTLPFEHTWTSYDVTSPAEVAGRIGEADIVITNKVKLTADAIARAKRLKLIAVAATGTNNVDLDACRARNIGVTNVRDYAVHTVPEHTFALIFALRRSLMAYRDAVRRGRWEEAGTFCFFDYPIKDLAGSTLGIIGNGALGTSVAAIASALQLKVLRAGRKGQTEVEAGYTPFDEVLKQSDIITLHCPLVPGTRNLIATPEFQMMARRPLLINTARGGLVDEQAVVDAIRSGQIAGAGFDVTTEEPPAPNHPFRALDDAPNFILTPHVAWASDEAVQALADQLIDNIASCWSDKPVNRVV